MNNFEGSRKPGWNRKQEPAQEQAETEVEEAQTEERTRTKRSFKGMPNKKVLFAGIGVVAVIVAVVLGFIFKGNNDEKLSASLIEMGRDWYENFYYDGFEESKRADILSRFKDIGIKVDLDNLSRYNTEVNAEKIKEFKPDEEGGCDKTETKIVIKPKDPYGKQDYDIEAILVCGDKKNENKDNQ